MASRRWWRSDAALPFMLGAAVLGLVVLAWAGASLVVPGWRGAAALAVASGAFVAAFLVWPKPTLVVFALFVLYYHTLGRWLAHDLRHVDEAVVPLLFLITAWKVRPWRRGLIDAVRDGALLLMLGMGVVSSLANPVPLAVWPLALLLLAKVFAFLYVVIWHDFNPADLRQIYPLVLALAAVTLALVPFELIDPPGFRAVLNLTDFSVPREGLPSVKSVFFQPVAYNIGKRGYTT
ncbi:MAG: hypothetical protein ABI797_07625, partial [Chloroflexota bacterium]